MAIRILIALGCDAQVQLREVKTVAVLYSSGNYLPLSNHSAVKYLIKDPPKVDNLYCDGGHLLLQYSSSSIILCPQNSEIHGNSSKFFGVGVQGGWILQLLPPIQYHKSELIWCCCSCP